MPGNDANSPSITNQLRNEELERRKAVANNYDMFADDANYLDTNVNLIRLGFVYSSLLCLFFRVPVHGVVKEM